MSLWILICVALPLIMLTRATFQAARRRAARRLPQELAAELRHHKLDCLHEPPDRVQLELELLLGEPSAAPRPRER
jgi:hypothetical protein